MNRALFVKSIRDARLLLAALCLLLFTFAWLQIWVASMISLPAFSDFLLNALPQKWERMSDVPFTQVATTPAGRIAVTFVHPLVISVGTGMGDIARIGFGERRDRSRHDGNSLGAADFANGDLRHASAHHRLRCRHVIAFDMVWHCIGSGDVSTGEPTTGIIVPCARVLQFRPDRLPMRHVGTVLLVGKPTVAIDRLDGSLVRRFAHREHHWPAVGPLALGVLRLVSQRRTNRKFWSRTHLRLGRFCGFAMVNSMASKSAASRGFCWELAWRVLPPGQLFSIAAKFPRRYESI